MVYSLVVLGGGGGGRLVLCKAILNNLTTYYMCSYLLPRGVPEIIDKRRRAFFWIGKESCSGAHCLIVWVKVLLSKQEGGFGIKDLHRHYRCLLLNFVQKITPNRPSALEELVLFPLRSQFG